MNLSAMSSGIGALTGFIQSHASPVKLFQAGIDAFLQDLSLPDFMFHKQSQRLLERFQSRGDSGIADGCPLLTEYDITQ